MQSPCEVLDSSSHINILKLLLSFIVSENYHTQKQENKATKLMSLIELDRKTTSALSTVYFIAD